MAERGCTRFVVKVSCFDFALDWNVRKRQGGIQAFRTLGWVRRRRRRQRRARPAPFKSQLRPASAGIWIAIDAQELIIWKRPREGHVVWRSKTLKTPFLSPQP
ncbi:hypothetical protein AB1N83_004764 [Pleurotus pulmonarius]